MLLTHTDMLDILIATADQVAITRCEFPMVSARSCDFTQTLSSPCDASQVVQQYVADPLLIHGRKFHLRMWVVVTQHAPLHAYMHR